jgi:hypothetical protein
MEFAVSTCSCPKTRFKDESEDIDKVAEALASAQGSYKTLKANQDGPRGEYANLNAIILATREALKENTLCLRQYEPSPCSFDDPSYIRTVLTHKSGQFFSSTARVIKTKNEASNNDLIERLKRRHASMLLGIAPSSTDPDMYDDDGADHDEELMIEEIKKPREAKKNIQTEYEETVDKHQYNELMIQLHELPELAADMLKVHGIESLADLPKSEYHRALKRIRMIRKASEI